MKQDNRAAGWADDQSIERPMGWGDPTKTVEKNLADERAIADVLMSSGSERFQDAGQWIMRSGPVGRHPAIEKLKSKFEFDDGFGFWVPEQIVYNATVITYQEIGNCVGESHACLLGARVAAEILCVGEGEEPLGPVGDSLMFVPYIPYSYGVGRCNRNGTLGSSRLNGDGSLCSWQIYGTMAHGILPSDTAGLHSPPDGGSASNQRAWGSNSGGVLNEWRPKAINTTLMQSVFVSDADTAKSLILDHLVPLQICSGWGFAYSHTDGELAVYKPSGSWAHSMQVIGWFTYRGTEYVVIRNQWGANAHRKAGLGIPLGCFVIPADTFARWIRDSETASIAQVKGRPSPPDFPH